MAQKNHIPFRTRYSEWAFLNFVTDDIDLKNKKILDVGAWFGHDSAILNNKGATVTSIEFNPFMTASGKYNLPDAVWLGGFSHILPFKYNVFDFVFFNASLHHMRDIQAAITEALRVLKPEGWLISLCDPFRADELDEAFELRAFNEYPMVLSGVNERIAKFSEYQFLKEFKKQTQPFLYTKNLWKYKDNPVMNEMKSWNYEADASFLSQTCGNLGMKVKLLSKISVPELIQTNSILEISEFVCKGKKCGDIKIGFAHARCLCGYFFSRVPAF